MAQKKQESKKSLTPDLVDELTPDGIKITSGIKVKAPRQKDNKTVYYTIGEPIELRNLADPGNFSPGRFIANIILDKDASIDPPVEVSIEVTQADVARAKGRTFKLAYHDGSQWVVVKQDIPSQAGYVSFELSKRGDPATGISP